jgi:hypothetical protein
LKTYIIDGQDYKQYTDSPVQYQTVVFKDTVNIQVRSNDPQNTADKNEESYAQLPQRAQPWTLILKYGE